MLGSVVPVVNHWCSICIHALNQLLEASDGYLAFPYLFGQNITLALARQAREVGCPLGPLPQLSEADFGANNNV